MFLTDFIDKICRPNPQVIKDPMEFEMTLKRNKTLFLMYSFTLFMIGSAFFMSKNKEREPMSLAITLNIIKIIFFVCTCRSYPKTFMTVYFLILAIYCPSLLFFSKEAIYFNAFSVIILPTFALFLLGLKSFIFQIFWQAILLHKFYQPILASMLENYTLELFVPRMIKLITIALVINAFLLFIMQAALKQAYFHIVVEKNKKDELERQKIFLLSFSHELRNLINTMIGAAQLSLLEPLPAKVRELLHNSEVCGELLLHLVNNILDTGKAEIGELEINPAPNQVYQTLEKVWSICSQLIKTKNLTGQIRIHKALPQMLRIDHYRLMQILMNLIGNSIKFTDHGAVNIDVEWIADSSIVNEKCFEPTPFDEDGEGIFEKAQNTSMLDESLIVSDISQKKIKPETLYHPSRTSPSGILKIVVSDTGCGVPPEKLPLLFSKFGQVSSDPSKRKVGTGLGLFITKELINKMGGDIRPYSKEGKGTAFIACIPAKVIRLQQSRGMNIDIDTFMRQMKPQKLKALIVDDIEGNRTLLTNYLHKLGVTDIQVAWNGQEAFEKYRNNSAHGLKPFDIVTMDVSMPVLNGKRATELIRKFERENRLARSLLVMISGNCSESEIAACIGGPLKADFFLKKPTSLQELFNIMKTRWLNGQSVNKQSFSTETEFVSHASLCSSLNDTVNNFTF